MYNIKNIILVFSQSRSGHHAIIDWLYNQFDDIRLFFNYNDPKAFDPLFENRVQYYLNDKKYYKVISNSWIDDGITDLKVKEFLLEAYENIKIIQVLDKNLLILNYENIEIEDVSKISDEITKYFQTSKVYKVFVVRDILNLLASKIKSGKDFTIKDLRKNDVKIKNTIDTWLKYNKYFIDNKDYITIIYNEWFKDANYRSKILDIFRIKDKDLSLPKLATFGKGSSFDGYNINKESNSMDVLERWKKYKNEKNFIDICYNKDVEYYTKSIFGNNLYK